MNKSPISQRNLKQVFRHFHFLKWASHIFLLCGKIWLRRNTIVFGGDLTHSVQLVRSAKEAVMKFYEAEQKTKNNVEHTPATFIPKWMFVLYNVIKTNWDVVIDKNKKEDGCRNN
jgi:hypothetical protein